MFDDANVVSSILSACVGGCLSLMGTILILRNERKKLKYEQIARLKHENRWAIARELYKKFSDMYWALRSLGLPGNRESVEADIRSARAAVLKFRIYASHIRFLLNKDLVEKVDALEMTMVRINSDLAGYAESLHSDSPQARDTAKFLSAFRANHMKSLTEGAVKKGMEAFEVSLRQFIGDECE